MTMCSHCRHWIRNESNKREPTRGTCRLTRSVYGGPKHPESLAVAYDAESYAAGLETAETFSCSQWEAK